MPRKSPDAVEVMAALGKLLRRGLPVTPAAAEGVLLDLRGVVARSVDPADDTSRTTALDGTLRGLLARYPDARYAAAARALFGLPPSESGENLTVRRERAASEAGHEVHHFRKRVEPKLVERVAWELVADAERFSHMPMIAPRLAPAAARETVPADPFAWEVAEQEEQLARLWSAVYAARAELLAVERLSSLGATPAALNDAALTAAWRWATARTEALSYASAYAGDLSAAQLIALAGWTPPLSDQQAAQLTAAAAGAASLEQFAQTVSADAAARDSWLSGLLAQTNEKDGSDQ